MMEEVNEQVCRFCRNNINWKDFIETDDVVKEILDGFLLELNFDYQAQYLLCNICSSKLYAALNFKRVCVNNNNTITSEVNLQIPLSVDLKEICLKEKQRILENNASNDLNKCRLCMQFLNTRSASERKVPDDIIKLYIPDIDFGITNPTICKKCFASVCEYGTFIKNGLELEGKVNIYAKEDLDFTEDFKIKTEVIEQEEPDIDIKYNDIKREENEESERLEVGKQFSSYSELKNFIEKYENSTYTKFWKRDAKLLLSNYSKGPVRSELIYAYLKYSCIYGGQPFRPRGKKRTNTNTFKKENLCPVFISLSPSTNGNYLEIKKFNDKHNHDANIIHPRWAKQYYKEKQRCAESSVTEDVLSKNPILTYAEKRKKVLQETNILTDLVALSSNVTYLQRLSVIKNLQFFWRNNVPVRIVPLNKDGEVNKNPERNVCSESCIVNHGIFENVDVPCANNEEITTKDNVRTPTIYSSRSTDKLTEEILNNVPYEQNESVETLITNCSNNKLEVESNTDVLSSKTPAIRKKRRRPGRSEVSATGSKKKRNEKAVVFSELEIRKKQEHILSWVLTGEGAFDIRQSGELIEEACIENDPQKISDAVLEADVDISLIRPLLSQKAWKALQRVISRKKRKLL